MPKTTNPAAKRSGRILKKRSGSLTNYLNEAAQKLSRGRGKARYKAKAREEAMKRRSTPKRSPRAKVRVDYLKSKGR